MNFSTGFFGDVAARLVGDFANYLILKAYIEIQPRIVKEQTVDKNVRLTIIDALRSALSWPRLTGVA